MSQVLRPYQVEAVTEVNKEFDSGVKSVLLVLPTGSGKTSIGSHLINQSVSQGKSVIFLAHRKELIEQCSQRLDGQGVSHGIIKAGNKRVNGSPVQVASIATLINRVRPKDGQLLGHNYKADLIVVDEAHRTTSEGTYGEVIRAFPNAKLLGLTATPYRTDGKGLGEMFETIVSVSSPEELTKMGYLVPARVFTTPLVPDFSKIKTKMGEFDKVAVDAAMNNAKLVGDVYTQWKKHGSDRKTVIFASSCEHGKSILGVFIEKGEKAAYLDGTTPDIERTQILDDLASGVIQVVINMGVLTEGWDSPSVSCIVLARPTKSLGLYLQMAGRALRPYKDKGDCIIIDHGGNTLRHGLVIEPREFSLEGDKGRAAPPRLTTCFKCNNIHQEKKCPECGHQNTKPKPAVSDEEKKYLNAMEIVEGDLEELDLVKILERRKQEIEFFRSCIAVQSERGFKTGYAKKLFLDKFGRWPGKEIGIKPIWGLGYNGGPPKGYSFHGVDYMDK